MVYHFIDEDLLQILHEVGLSQFEFRIGNPDTLECINPADPVVHSVDLHPYCIDDLLEDAEQKFLDRFSEDRTQCTNPTKVIRIFLEFIRNLRKSF